MKKSTKIKLTEDSIKSWIKERVKEGGAYNLAPTFELMVKNRLRKMELKFGWELDEYIFSFRKTWRILLWKEVVTKLRKRRLACVAVTYTVGSFKFEYTLVRKRDFKAWMEGHGRGVCPNCHKFVEKWWLDEKGACTECIIKQETNKCQICGNHKGKYPRPWDVDMCKKTRVDSMLPICDECRKEAYIRYEQIMNGLRRTHEDMWVRAEGCRYKVKVTATPIEGNNKVMVYAFDEPPTKKEMKKLRVSMLGYVDVDIQVKDLGYYN